MTKMTEAFKKILNYRDSVNLGRARILSKDLSSVFYLYKTNDLFCVVAYRGRAKKPAFHYHYKTEAQRKEKIMSFMKTQAKNKTTREKAIRNLEVGDVLKAVWGYEQTNINYYLVTKLIAKTMVEIVEIGKIKEDKNDMSAKIIPNVNHIIGEPMKRKVYDNRVRINNIYSAVKKVKTKVLGCDVYSSDYESSYY